MLSLEYTGKPRLGLYRECKRVKGGTSGCRRKRFRGRREDPIDVTEGTEESMKKGV